MTTGLKPYPTYKPTGLPWLGDVPEQWEIERAKTLFKKMDRPVQNDDEVITCFRDGIVTLRQNRRIRGFTESLKEIGYQGIRKGDLVIHQMDAFAGAIGVSDSDGKGTPVYSVCEPSLDASSYYYAHIIREMARTQWILALAKGIRERSTDFRFETFASQYVPLPPLDEQTAIVRFLDYADRRIRRYILAKQKLVKLLEEQKQAIIHHAVTRGLNPDVRLKPSGVDWLGEIPEHWKVTRIKNEFRCLNSQRIPLSSTERGAMTIRKYDYYGASGIIDKVEDYLFDDELILIAEDGANLVLRNLPLAIIARGKFWVNNHAHILKPRQGNINYLASLLEGLNFQPWISGAAQPKLTKDRLLTVSISLPPPSEQSAIIEWAENETATIRYSIGKTLQEIVLLREYRTRLIADVVTGKLDVRDAGARLPDEFEEPEPLEEAIILEDQVEASDDDGLDDREGEEDE